MTWTNPIDRLPQLRSDWANHIAYGGVLGIVVLCIYAAIPWHLKGLSAADAGTLAVLLVAAVKKAFDYVKVGPPTESLAICVGKTFVTAVWPASISLFALMSSAWKV